MPGNEKEKEKLEKKQYETQVKQAEPKPSVLKNSFWAFVVGGLICVIAQLISMGFQGVGLVEKDANTATLVIMVFLGAFLTGLGIYDSIAKVAGAGSLVPITGFANSIVSPAMEYKREGFIYGIGARMFNVAGPVLLYGFLISTFIGLIAFIFS